MTDNTPNFEVVEFNPTIAELQNKVNSYKDLKIKDIDDEIWYEMVKKAQLDLRDTRVTITKFWKSLRDWANAYAKKVIEEENRLVCIIEGTEKELKAERERIDEEIEKEKRRKVMPARLDELARNGIEAEYNTIISMTSDEFNKFVLDKRQQMLDEKEAKLTKEKNDIVISERKKRFDEVSNMTMPDDVFLRYTDEEFDTLIENTKKKKAEAEEKAVHDAEEKVKKEQADKEAKEKKDQEEKEKQEKLAQEQLEKDTKYKNWLKEHWYNADGFLITTNGNEKTMWSKVSTFIM